MADDQSPVSDHSDDAHGHDDHVPAPAVSQPGWKAAIAGLVVVLAVLAGIGAATAASDDNYKGDKHGEEHGDDDGDDHGEDKDDDHGDDHEAGDEDH